MRVTGWGLIVVFGGAILFLVVDWLVRTLDGYYVDGESTTALLVTGMAALVAMIPIGVGVWLVRRSARS